jgi:hypothetical protein
MNSPDSPSSPGNPPHGVPTLTEVVDWHDPAAAPPAVPADEASVVEAAAPAPLAAPVPLPAPNELTEQVLVQVQRQLDLMIEYRLREALTPLLARATDNLVRDARNELASTLRDVVARAVANELARLRNR